MKKEIIKFHNTDLVAILEDERVYVAINPIAEAIGLDTDWAAKSIKNHPILGDQRRVHTVSGIQNKPFSYVTLPIDTVNGWLFSINPNRVKPEARAFLLSYQKECFRVLYDHFFNKNNLVIEKQKRRFELQQELKNAESKISFFSLEKKRIYKELAEIDHDIFLKLNLFPDEQLAIQG